MALNDGVITLLSDFQLGLLPAFPITASPALDFGFWVSLTSGVVGKEASWLVDNFTARFHDLFTWEQNFQPELTHVCSSRSWYQRFSPPVTARESRQKGAKETKGA